MGTVTFDLFAVILLVSFLLVYLLKISRNRDRQEILDRQRRTADEQQLHENIAKLYQAGIPLICLGCNTRFEGPMPSDGCPQCHMSTLVVTMDEYNKSVEARQ